MIVSVSDEGPGVDRADLPYLGDRFYRGGDINERPGGLGLGLALVSQILTLHGSSLEIESREGLGARFSFRLAHLGVAGDSAREAASDPNGVESLDGEVAAT